MYSARPCAHLLWSSLQQASRRHRPIARGTKQRRRHRLVRKIAKSQHLLIHDQIMSSYELTLSVRCRFLWLCEGQDRNGVSSAIIVSQSAIRTAWYVIFFVGAVHACQSTRDHLRRCGSNMTCAWTITPASWQLPSRRPPSIPFFCIAPELYTHLLRTPNGVEGAPLGAMHAHGSSCMLVGALHSESFAPPWLSYMHGLPCMQGMWI